jgi:UDP-glucose:(heptosyl)LPS alpha-1,3-glucosyltransferase
MKIALVIYTFWESRGGAERACANLARGLLAQGHEVHLYSAVSVTEDVPPGAVVHTVPANALFPSWRHRTFARSSKVLLEKERFDIIHSFSRTTYQDILRLGGGTHAEFLRSTAGQRSRLDRFWVRISAKHRVQMALDREALAGGAFRRIVTVSQRGKESVLRDYPVQEADVVVIRNGVDVVRFTPELGSRRAAVRRRWEIPDQDLLYLFCGRNGLLKGLDTLIEAMARLPRSIPARLLSVGERHDARFMKLARDLGVQDRVRFLGPQPGMEDFYGAADVFVHPSRYDPAPNVCLEAMASGLPLIATSCTGVAEIVRDGQDAFVVEKDDAEGLASKMAALADPDRRRGMGTAARRTAEGRSMEAVLRENLAVYDLVRREKRLEAATGPAPGGRRPVLMPD